jgi:hypothetical protein
MPLDSHANAESPDVPGGIDIAPGMGNVSSGFLLERVAARKSPPDNA